ncbi:DUF6318 family protein [uncultured Serinicoccus sp.]|uniref:DUF6318 family protein n=1 Tax=uncultured Serinicoccus sp. TaxID=735514 RepID=UPI00260F7245|nr:DUF6318 family protein [uncultured Serinicoccus sp.]
MRRTAIIIAAAASLALLPACTDQSEPSPMPTSEDALTTATEEPEDVAVTSEPVETEDETQEPDDGGPPEMPAEAEEQTEEGAEAFVTHYLDTYNASFASGDSEPLKDFGTDSCDSCSQLIGTIPVGGQPGEDYLSYSAPNGLLTPDGARVSIDVEQRTEDAEERVSGEILVTLVWSSSWRIEEIQVLQS